MLPSSLRIHIVWLRKVPSTSLNIADEKFVLDMSKND